MKKGKLELTWVGKDERVRLEPRVLAEDAAKSYGDPKAENMLIFGDNLLALKALEQDFAGRIKCIAIDPPYNTGNAFAQYDDGLEHSLWLSLMRDRLEQLKKLLDPEGTIWVCIDDDESHYLKILCDEVFGRQNFVANIVWQKKYGPANDAKWLSDSHDHILLFARDKEKWRPNLIPRSEEQLQDYKNPDNDPRGIWRASDLSAKTPSPSCMYPITGPNGKIYQPPPTRSWVVSKERFDELLRDNRIWFGVKGTGRPMVKKFLTEVKGGITVETWWPREFADDNKIAKYESKDLFDGDSFATPKPEKLLHRILQTATNDGDWVLDSFAGSGTTGAVAQKMGRKWIMCEMGEHCHTHIIPRLKAVIDGEQGGISPSVNWKGGGGFKYYRLAESLLVQDADLSTKDRPVYIINPRYNAVMLIRAICKIENFRYRNDGRMHGISSESRFLHITTQLLTQKYIDSLAEDIGPNQSLLIYATRCARGLHLPPNVEVKKIPRDLLAKCDFQEEK